MATGALPFCGNTTAEIYDAILNRQPTPVVQANREAPRGLQQIIDKALEKDRELRYQSAADIRADLQRLKRDTESRSAIDAKIEPASRRKVGRWATVGAAVLVLALAAISYFSFRSPSVHALTDKDVIVLADFTNNTGEPVFDSTLKEALAIDLGQSPFLNIVPDRKVQGTLRLMGKPPDQRISPDIAREICLRIGSKAMIAGSVSKLGSQYAIQLKATNCDSGDMLGITEAEAEKPEKTLHALHEAGSELRQKLGESLASVQNFNTPLEEATTSSLEALRLFSDTFKVRDQRGSVAALPLLKRAVQLDPQFARAYDALCAQYSNLGEASQGAEYCRKAFSLRDRASKRERYKIVTDYYSNVTGELDKYYEQCELWHHDYPKDPAASNALALVNMVFGHYEEAVATLREPPPDGIRAYNLALSYIALNRTEDAKKVIQPSLNNGVDDPFLRSITYMLAFVLGDGAGMKQELATAAGRPQFEEIVLSLDAATQAYFGRIQKARVLSEKAAQAARQNGHNEAAALIVAEQAVREAHFGHRTEATFIAGPLLAKLSGRGVRANAALALAVAGDTRARKAADQLNRQYPLATLLQNYILPCIDAALEISQGRSHQALENLQRTSMYEFGWFQVDSMYPSYLRGQAYLLAQDGAAAAGEFQKIIDHPGIVLNSHLGPLARLGLARAHVLEAKSASDATAAQAARTKARSAYQELLSLWKDADPDLPILKQAKAEYARLQ